MRRRQVAYNSQGIRCDGNFKLTKFLRLSQFKKRTTTVVVAFCGTDGSLLDVPAPLPMEGFDHIQTVLEPLLREIQEVRTACGYSLLESQPVFHATGTVDYWFWYILGGWSDYRIECVKGIEKDRRPKAQGFPKQPLRKSR